MYYINKVRNINKINCSKTMDLTKIHKCKKAVQTDKTNFSRKVEIPNVAPKNWTNRLKEVEFSDLN